MKALLNAIKSFQTTTSVVYTEKTHKDDSCIDAAVVFKKDGNIFRLSFVLSDRSYLLEEGFLTEECITDSKTGKLVIAKKFNVVKANLQVTESIRKQYHKKLLNARMI